MERLELNFDAVDDLVGAHLRGKLSAVAARMRFSPNRLGPLVELVYQWGKATGASVLSSPWLDAFSNRDMREALSGNTATWLDAPRHRGFLRTVFDPLKPEDDPPRTRFLMAARVAAEQSGFPVPVAQSLAAAVREMESNIHEHSQGAASGLLAFQARNASFEFVVADAGVGVLPTLSEAPEFRSLSDHGRALQLALQEGTSRFGRDAHRGMGFRDLFVGLASLNANLRFRSGDHALTIDGPRPELKVAQLAQKPFFRGFLASVSCRLPTSSRAMH